MSKVIRLILQQPGQQPGLPVPVPLHGGKIHIGSIKQEFGLRALKKVTPTEPEPVLLYEDKQGWSIDATFVAGETVTVCGTPIAAQHKPVGEATLDTRIERLEQSLKAQLQQEREERQQERQQLLVEINKLQDERNGVYTGHLKVH